MLHRLPAQLLLNLLAGYLLRRIYLRGRVLLPRTPLRWLSALPAVAMKLNPAPDDTPGLQRRFIILSAVAAGIFGILLLRLWQLQVVNDERYRALSERNRTRFIHVDAPRGTMYDRNGVMLVDSRPAFTVSVLRQEVCRSAGAVPPSVAVARHLDHGRARDSLARLARVCPAISHCRCSKTSTGPPWKSSRSTVSICPG